MAAASNTETDAEALYRQGAEAQALGEFAEAARCFSTALALHPPHALAQLAMAQLAMFASGFRQGREYYETRFAARGGKEGLDWRAFPGLRWRGESLKGKRIYVAVEQGLGDAVLFAGFLPRLLQELPARAALGTFPKTVPLFARSFPSIDVEPMDRAADRAMAALMGGIGPELDRLLAILPEADSAPFQALHGAMEGEAYDCFAPLGDLMVHFLPDFIPARRQRSYLTADSEKQRAARQEFEHLGAGRKIGISWHTPNVNNPQRGISLAELEPLLKTENCCFIALQHQFPPREIQDFCSARGVHIHVDPEFDPVHDVEGLAARIAALDEIVTIDNSNAHLAGALGIPATLLLPKGCDFRWPLLENEGETLWYQSVRAVRQEAAGDWSAAIQQIAKDLRHRK